MNDKPKFEVRCNIPSPEGEVCGHVIAIQKEPLKVPTIGGETDSRAKSLIQAITQHVMKKHPGHGSFLFACWEQYLGYHALCMCEADDPNVSRFVANYAQHLCRIATMPVSDDAIVETVARIGFTMEDPHREKVIEAMKYLRDFQSRKLTPQSAVPA